MGVYIKGMTFPKSCRDCDLEYDSFYCRLVGKKTIYIERDDEKLEGCPLIEVKVPYGDLADVSEVKKCLHDLPDSEDKWGALALLEWAMEKRTVIETEGAEE